MASLAAAALVAAAGFCASAAIAANGSQAIAKGDAGGPTWNELSPPHRQILAPLANDWNALDSRSKERWIDVAGRFHKMPPDEQQRATQRMGEWAHMSIQQRTRARTVFQETRGLSKEEREARWKAYQALPEEKKRELAATRAAAPASAPSNAAFARRHAPPAVDVVQPKNNLIGGSASARSSAGSAPLLVEPKRPGVTTTLLTRRATPPAHQREGAPKIAVGPNAVDRTTLLPKHATVAAAPASAPASVRR
ncbi:MAG: DUF3106 domain-containing protein [Burkholderiales bacterium]|nr:DUF3106 domain-containing protein [Burkholderiales bacterium]